MWNSWKCDISILLTHDLYNTKWHGGTLARRQIHLLQIYIYIYMSVCEFQISASQGLFRLFASIFIEWAKLHLPLSHFNLLLQPCYCSLYAIASCTCSCLMNVENLVEELRIRTDAYTIGTFSKWWCKYLFDRLHHNQQIWTHRDSLSCFRLSWTEKM